MSIPNSWGIWPSTPFQIVTRCDDPHITTLQNKPTVSLVFTHSFFRHWMLTFPLRVIIPEQERSLIYQPLYGSIVLRCVLAKILLEWRVSTVLPTFIKQYRWQYLCSLSGLWNEYQSGSVAPAFTHLVVLLKSALNSCSVRVFPVFCGIPALAQAPQFGLWARCLITELECS